MKIKEIKALEILDSRGNPTVSAQVTLEDGSLGISAVPSGASTGAHEAVELRDKDKGRYHGNGVLKAINNIENKIFPVLKNMNAYDQSSVDKKMIDLDASENKENLGANAILAVSMACARAAAKSLNQPLYKYLRSLSSSGQENGYLLPVPMMNLLNGGRHADWSTDIQEYMVLPIGASKFSEAVRMSAEIYQSLKKILKENDYKITVGDEGGFAPAFKNNEEPFQFLTLAVKEAGYILGKDIVFGIDAAATEFYQENLYHLNKENKKLNSLELIKFYQSLADIYPIVSFEDPLAEDDWQGFKDFSKQFSHHQVVGDDLYVTKLSRLERGIKEKSSNSILIKLNQIGTVTETIAAIEMAKSAGFTSIISHRSGETEDTFIADFSVALATGQIKTGAPCRSERTAKYNRLLAIESELKDQIEYSRFPFHL